MLHVLSRGAMQGDETGNLDLPREKLDRKISFTAPSASESRPLASETGGIEIRDADVLCGRGKLSFNHSGNREFRATVAGSLRMYMTADNRFEKSLVVKNIVDKIQSENGRFLKKDPSSGEWYELSEQQAKEKVGHAIRDAVNSQEARRGRKIQTFQHAQQISNFHAHQPLPQSVVGAFATSMQSGQPIVQSSNTISFPNTSDIGATSRTQSVNDLSNGEMGSRYNPTFRATLQRFQNQLEPRPMSQPRRPLQYPPPAQHSHEEQDEFLSQIDSVLGPLPSNGDAHDDQNKFGPRL